MYSLQFLIVRTVKVRLQSAAAVGRYRSTFHALYTIFREERMSGLYRGIASPLVRSLDYVLVEVIFPLVNYYCRLACFPCNLLPRLFRTDNGSSAQRPDIFLISVFDEDSA